MLKAIGKLAGFAALVCLGVHQDRARPKSSLARIRYLKEGEQEEGTRKPLSIQEHVRKRHDQLDSRVTSLSENTNDRLNDLESTVYSRPRNNCSPI